MANQETHPRRWSVENLPWDQFDRSKVNPRLLAIAKGAALVEANAADYVTYLKNVFSGDEEIHRDIEAWGNEEKQHGLALRRWCERVDDSFDYDHAMKRFTAAFRVPLEAQESIRGSRALELVARCVVETGTSSFYSALRDAAEEPVFREICRRIAGDEIRHYNMFLGWLERRYADVDEVTRLQRMKIVWERSTEASSEELALAFAAANYTEELTEDKVPEYSKTFLSMSLGLYSARHLKTSMNLLGKAAGLKIKPWMAGAAAQVVHKAMRLKYH